VTLAETIELYLDEKRRILEEFPVAVLERAAAMLFETHDEGGTVYAMANGGNAGTLDHFYCDFKHHPFVTEDKTRPLPPDVKRLSFVNLCSSAAELTGLVNDIGAEPGANPVRGVLDPGQPPGLVVAEPPRHRAGPGQPLAVNRPEDRVVQPCRPRCSG